MDCPAVRPSRRDIFSPRAHREYLRSAALRLVFVPPRYFLDRTLNGPSTSLHENDIEDAGYRRFLSRSGETACPSVLCRSSRAGFRLRPRPGAGRHAAGGRPR